MSIFRALKQLRAIDDKIIYALNVSTPTASMQVGYARIFTREKIKSKIVVVVGEKRKKIWFTVFLMKEEYDKN